MSNWKLGAWLITAGIAVALMGTPFRRPLPAPLDRGIWVYNTNPLEPKTFASHQLSRLQALEANNSALVIPLQVSWTKTSSTTKSTKSHMLMTAQTQDARLLTAADAPPGTTVIHGTGAKTNLTPRYAIPESRLLKFTVVIFKELGSSLDCLSPNALLVLPRGGQPLSSLARAIEARSTNENALFLNLRSPKTPPTGFALLLVSLACWFAGTASLCLALSSWLSCCHDRGWLHKQFRQAGSLVTNNQSMFLWLGGIYAAFSLLSMIIVYGHADFQDSLLMNPSTFPPVYSGQPTVALWLRLPTEILSALWGAIQKSAIIIMPSLLLPPSGMVFAHLRGMVGALFYSPLSILGLKKLFLFTPMLLLEAQANSIASLFGVLVLKATIAPASFGKDRPYDAYRMAARWALPFGLLTLSFGALEGLYRSVLKTMLTSASGYGLW